MTYCRNWCKVYEYVMRGQKIAKIFRGVDNMKTGKLKRLCAIVSSASVLLGSAVLYSVASAESITPGTYDRDDVPDQA